MNRTAKELIEYFKDPALSVIHIGKEERKQTIKALEEHEIMKEMLCGQCWACEYGEPYRKHFEGAYTKNDKLTICTVGEHGENIIAKMWMEGCKQWKLKQK